ncbi:MAG: hypothetical protein QM488_08420 [Rhizobiaceae bacterium]
MSFFKYLGLIGCVFGGVALAGCSSTASSSNNSNPAGSKKIATSSIKPMRTAAAKQRTSDINRSTNGKISRTGEIYLLRGLANIFSRGMDVMGERMVRKGLDARVYNHNAWQGLANNIVARNKVKQVSYPIIIMGHSLGGNASMQMAKYLGDRGIKVRYVVAFDPTVTTFVGRNVSQVTNYYLPNEKHTNVVRKAAGFSGKLKNVRVTNIGGITHTNVEKNRGLQNKSIRHIMSLTKKRKAGRKRRG